MKKIIETKNISKMFGDVKALDNVTTTIFENDCYGLIGPNGSGKTTYIGVLLDLIKPDKGTIVFLSDSLEVKKDIGVVLDGNNIVENLTLIEYLEFIAKIYEVPEQEFENKVNLWLDLFELKSHKKRLLKHFSLGMIRKTQIISALIHKPKLLIIDEPTNGLDPNMVITLKEVIKLVGKMGISIFITTHNLGFAESVCNRVCIINDGRVIAEDYLDSLFKKTNTINLEETYKKLIGFEKREKQSEKIINSYL